MAVPSSDSKAHGDALLQAPGPAWTRCPSVPPAPYRATAESKDGKAATDGANPDQNVRNSAWAKCPVLVPARGSGGVDRVCLCALNIPQVKRLLKVLRGHEQVITGSRSKLHLEVQIAGTPSYTVLGCLRHHYHPEYCTRGWPPMACLHLSMRSEWRHSAHTVPQHDLAV